MEKFCDLLLVRHGETEENVGGRHQVYETRLSAVGRRQARALAGRVGAMGVNAIYSSDLRRAMETAEELAAATGLAVRTDPRLREHDVGVFKGLTRAEAMARDPEVYRRWLAHDCDVVCPEGESVRMVQQRVVEAVREIAAGHAGERVVVVTHGQALRTVLMHVLGAADSAFSRITTPNTGLNVIRARGDRLVLIGWGDTRHLEADG